VSWSRAIQTFVIDALSGAIRATTLALLGQGV
jgi:hypothetical protein